MLLGGEVLTIEVIPSEGDLGEGEELGIGEEVGVAVTVVIPLKDLFGEGAASGSGWVVTMGNNYMNLKIDI